MNSWNKSKRPSKEEILREIRSERQLGKYHSHGSGKKRCKKKR